MLINVDSIGSEFLPVILDKGVIDKINETRVNNQYVPAADSGISTNITLRHIQIFSAVSFTLLCLLLHMSTVSEVY